MKLEIYNELKKEEEQVIRLKLQESMYSGNYEVVVVDENGIRVEYGTLIMFRSDGTIRRANCVSPNLGFQLDGERRIKLGGE